MKHRHAQRGFTLLELLLVLLVLAIASVTVSLNLPSTEQTALDREATRLAALFDAARSQSRATGLPVTWSPSRDTDNPAVMRWQGINPALALPQNWLDSRISAQIVAAPATPQLVSAETKTVLVLGPDPVIEAQQVRLSLGGRTRSVQTDGVNAFVVKSE